MMKYIVTTKEGHTLSTDELRSALSQFTGTEHWHFNRLYKWMKYTDGVVFFALNAGGGAYWFLDIIGTELMEVAKSEKFLVINLHVNSDGTATITASDGNESDELEWDDHIKYRRSIESTDCPEGEWTFYLTDNVLMLPSEY